MPAVDIKSLALRDAGRLLAKRNWASEEPGVILVLCIVFIVGTGLGGLYISRWFSRRKAAKQDI